MDDLGSTGSLACNHSVNDPVAKAGSKVDLAWKMHSVDDFW